MSSSDLNRQLFRVRPATGDCVLVPFTPPLTTTGMAFSEDRGTVGETLYVTSSASWLTAVDTSTFTSQNIGQDAGTPLASWVGTYGSDSPPLLTGTGAGDLFAATSFLAPPGPCVAVVDAGVPPPPRKCKPISQQPPLPPTANIGRIDKSNGSVTTAWSVTTSLNLVPPLKGFAAWGEDFYLFVPQLSGAVVLRFRTSDQSTVEVAQTDASVLAVGVSTCAPLP